jgi:26S proteasome regulatory subunit N10
MVLEATILCIDNSDWTRNGDYIQTRFQTQIEAANLIIENRFETNPENSLGIMTMAGKRVEMISTLTNDESRLLNSMNNIPLNGECDIISALSIAILCLKHRTNKNQKQRIILFIGSPVQAKKENLIQIGKKLKKYNVAVDIISFGNVEENRESLNILLNEVNNSDNSSIIEVPVGAFIMDTLLSSPIMAANNIEPGNPGEQGANPQGNQMQMGGLSQFERDMNLALQMSLQEAQKNENKDKNSTPDNINAKATKALEVIEEEDQELENARLLSIQENNKIIQKENEAKEKKAANEILESQDFLNDLLNQVDAGSNAGKKEEDKKKEEEEDKKKKEDKKESKKKDDDKMEIDK